MKPGNHISLYLGSACLAVAVALPAASFAQKHQAPPPPPPRAEVSRPQPEHAPQTGHQDHIQSQGHAGDWLRRYGDLPPDEQERALQSDPAFRRLSPERQQKYRERLQHFSSLTPEQQLRVLNRMETWEHLTPQQKQETRQVFAQFRQLPADRQHLVKTAIEDLRAMPVDQREQVINSDKFKGTFSDQERELMRGAARLPLAPPGEGGTQE
jgi:Protein of unknown function (DUF3106)